MVFKEALELMKQGVSVKLPSWGGYWCWNSEKETIEMHCREKDSDTGKDVLDIRETQRVEYTLSNIISDEWIVATKDNTPILGGVATFSFSEAIKYIKRGLKVSRQGWNGKGQFLELATCISYTNSQGEVVNPLHKSMGRGAIAFVGISGVQLGWLATQADMLAEDWIIVE